MIITGRFWVIAEAEAAITLVFVVGYWRGRIEEGEQLGLHAGAIVKRLQGKHELEAKWLNNMGIIYWLKRDYDKAQEHHERSLEIWQRTMGLEHPGVAKSLANLGAVFEGRGDYKTAQDYYERSLTINVKAMGPEHPEIVLSLLNMANVFQINGKYDEAQEYDERALALGEKVLGPEHYHVAISLNNLGELLVAKGEYDKAVRYLERALAIKQKVVGAEHSLVATTLSSLAIAYEKKREVDRAYRYSTRALSICKTGSCQPGVVASAAFSAAKALLRADHDRGRALELAKQAHSGFAQLPGKKKELAEVDAWLAKHRGSMVSE